MPGKKQIGLPLGVRVLEHPGDHAQDFAHRWRDKLEEYVTVRMEELGIPIEMIGQPDYESDGRWHAFDPYGRKGGANTTGVVVDSGILNPDLLKGKKGQGVEQNFQRVVGNSTNDKIGILSHEGNGHGNPIWRHKHAKESAKQSQLLVVLVIDRL